MLEPGAGMTGGWLGCWRCCFCWASVPGCSRCHWKPTCSIAVRRSERGSVLAAMNFLVFLGILLVALLFAGLRQADLSGFAGESGRGAGESRAAVGRRSGLQSDALAARFRRGLAGGSPICGERRRPGAGCPTGRQFLQFVRQCRRLRDAACAQLLWVEFRQRRRRGEFFTKDDYLRAFADVADQQMVSDVYYQASELPLFTARQIFLLAGLFTIPVFLYIVFLIPQASVRFLVWLASRTVYRIRVHGHAHLPEEGGALLVANHVSWLDGILLLLTSSRPVRIVAFASGLRGRRVRWLAKMAGVILVAPGSKELRSALEAAREALKRGELVGIFPEGGMTPDRHAAGLSARPDARAGRDSRARHSGILGRAVGERFQLPWRALRLAVASHMAIPDFHSLRPTRT